MCTHETCVYCIHACYTTCSFFCPETNPGPMLPSCRAYTACAQACPQLSRMKILSAKMKMRNAPGLSGPAVHAHGCLFRRCNYMFQHRLRRAAADRICALVPKIHARSLSRGRAHTHSCVYLE